MPSKNEYSAQVGVLRRPHLEEIERAVAAGQRCFRTDTEGRFARALTNLGWLLRNWQQVRQFEVTRPPGGSSFGRSDVIMVAELMDGTYYVTEWASRGLMEAWLRRPVFRDVPVVWHTQKASEKRPLSLDSAAYEDSGKRNTILSPDPTRESHFAPQKKVIDEIAGRQATIGGSSFVTTLRSRRGEIFDVLKNPSVAEMERLGFDAENSVRCLVVGDDLLCWPGDYAIHHEVIEALNLSHEKSIRLELKTNWVTKQVTLTVFRGEGWPEIDWTTFPYFMSHKRLFKGGPIVVVDYTERVNPRGKPHQGPVPWETAKAIYARGGDVIGSGDQPAWSDPSTPPEVLARLVATEPRALMNPNMPFEALKSGADDYPLYVEQNPVRLLLSLESPEQGALLERSIDGGWCKYTYENPSQRYQRRFAIDCAEHVLHIFEELCHGDKYPRTAIETAKRYADGNASHATLQRMLEKSKAYASGYEPGTDKDYARNYALNSAVATLQSSNAAAAKNAAVKAQCAAGFFALGDAEYSRRLYSRGFYQEQAWQANRARHYYGLEHPEYQPPDVIGAKPKWSDPSVNPAELLKQATRVPKTYTNPNIPIKALIDNAHKYPWYAERNPVIPLLSIEDPARCEQLLSAVREGWLTTAAQALSIPNQRRLVIDCAARVLPILQKLIPGDHRPANSIAAAQKYVDGEISATELNKAFEAADLYADTSNYLPPRYLDFGVFAESAAEAASYASYPDKLFKSEPVAKTALMAAYSARGGDHFIAEQTWQINRVKHYYSLEHPEYQPPDTIGKNVTRSKVSTVAGKSKWNDPSLKPEDLVKLAKRNHRAYANPNLPLDVLLKAARKYPWYVEQNLALPLLRLESPENAESLLRQIKLGWIEADVDLLSLKTQRGYAAEMAERVLPIYQKKNPGDPGPRTAIKSTRDCAAGKITEGQLSAIELEGRSCLFWANDYSRMANIPEFSYAEKATFCAAAAAFYSAVPVDTTQSSTFISNVRYAAMYAVSYAARMYRGKRVDDWIPKSNAALSAEQNWQIERFRELFYLEHPECLLSDGVGAKARGFR